MDLSNLSGNIYLIEACQNFRPSVLPSMRRPLHLLFSLRSQQYPFVLTSIVLSVLDTDKNGYLDFKEFQQVVRVVSRVNNKLFQNHCSTVSSCHQLVVLCRRNFYIEIPLYTAERGSVCIYILLDAQIFISHPRSLTASLTH